MKQEMSMKQEGRNHTSMRAASTSLDAKMGVMEDLHFSTPDL